MKRIIKGKAPQSLIQHRLSSNSDYDNYPDKGELREALLKEQGYICCYCMQRIYANDQTTNMKIEHWASQSKYPHLQLSYNNLLGACMGNEGARPIRQHCDTCKGDAEIKINPSESTRNCELLVEYNSNGEIHSKDADIENDLVKTLNLNLVDLVNARKEALSKIVEQLNKEFSKKPWSSSAIKREIDKLRSSKNGKLEPFCQFAISYLERRL